jgi:hypothetical protein
MSENTINVGYLSEALGAYKNGVQDPLDIVRTALQSLHPTDPKSTAAITRGKLELAHKQRDQRPDPNSRRLNEESKAIRDLNANLGNLPDALVLAAQKVKNIASCLIDFATNVRNEGQGLDAILGLPTKAGFEEKLAPLLAS